MAIRYYDEALTDKLKSWIKDPKMTVYSPGQVTHMFQVHSDKSNDKPLKLPLITITRENEFEIVNTNQRALTYDGGHIAANTEKSEVLNGIPIKLNYQLDIYTKYFAEADEYVRNFIFNLINYPRVQIEIPYRDSKIVHNSTIILQSGVTENSDLPEQIVSGQFTRMTLRFSIEDAYLFSIPLMDNWNIMYEDEIKIEGED